ncbi:hypothetical protein BV25DRAFT_1817124 [Artomyces pyxidatus]|uniref:Uncharacterized protein n=1 Tax=Artomyces pyxidatus TaxID=48021 RepID=A0ACB8SD29_9AGAM|nr:hypothetical protein BV25DRAFT_1817124 [Artomyces pyxidatus]
MLSRGVTFEWRVRDGDLVVAWARQPPPFTLGSFRLPPWWSIADDVFKAYGVRARDILSRPHARRFVVRGGILWRLALEYGGVALLEEALEGPSPIARAFGLGSRWLYPEKSVGDRFFGEEVMDVVGARGDRSLWPLPDVFESSMAWRGEWSDHNELWFQRRLRLMAQGAAQFLRASAWQRELRSDMRAEDRLGEDGVGSLTHAGILLGQHPEARRFGLIALGS